jgi:undecaprenyl-diphosphatase
MVSSGIVSFSSSPTLFSGRSRMKRWKLIYVVSAVSASAFIARSVRSGKTVPLDRAVTRSIQKRKGPQFAKVMRIASWAGFPPQSRTIPFVLPALLFLTGRRRDARFQLMGWGTSLISGTIKTIMQRPRPSADEFDVQKANIGGTSFPSGHVINYMGVYGTLAVIMAHNIKWEPLRKLVLGAIGTKLALVGPSRIYLGHHWFTDVLTSYLLGSSYVLVISSLYKRAFGKR